MIRVVNILVLVFTISSLVSCSSGGNDSDNENPNEGGDPGSVSLVFPENNSECTEGQSVNDTQSTITFMWEEATNADSYEVHVRNLNTNDINTINANTNERAISLAKNTPFEWFVISKAVGSNQSPSSAKWRFYNAGEGVENYAPFPAAVVSPTRGQAIASTTSVNLEWNGTDVDNDIDEYEVFFGTSTNPTVSLGTTQQTSITANVSSGQTYYWRVKTIDEAGNSSQSEVFDFRVQ